MWGAGEGTSCVCAICPPLVPSRFLCDDVDFNLRVHSAGLLLCRFNRFSVMKKQIAVGGHRSFHITSKVGRPCARLGGHPDCCVWCENQAWELVGRPRGCLRVSGVGLTSGSC